MPGKDLVACSVSIRSHERCGRKLADQLVDVLGDRGHLGGDFEAGAGEVSGL